MIRTNRLQVALLFALGLTVALLGCDSSSGGSNGTGGSAGVGGSGGAGGSPSGVLRILVTNDDGVGAEGIDAVVEALRGDPNNEVTVSAPAVNLSGTGDMTTPTPPPLEAMMTTTASGYPATAVDGSPADSVLYGLQNLFPDAPPHVVLSGINKGQNVGNIVGGLLSQISGTVGAAKTAACSGVPALASSQGEAEDDDLDYDAGVAEVLTWLEANRAALLAGTVPLDDITSINIPTCAPGSEIRGLLEVPLATENPNAWSLGGPQDCASTVEDPPNDIEAFFNGYVTVTAVPSNSSMTCDKLDN
jgi:5'-nucleotidase